MKQDPPMTPLRGSRTWYESDGALLSDEPSLANLMIRIGMAANAIQAQLQTVKLARRKPLPVRQLLLQSSLISSAALTFESLVLINKNMRVLRPLAGLTREGQRLLKSIGALMGGKHPASAILNRARNELGFHWDEVAVGRAVEDLARNESVIWLEFRADDFAYYRLSGEALTLSLLPPTQGLSKESLKATVTTTLDHVDDAMREVNQFFAHCIYAYFTRHRETRIHRRTRQNKNAASKRIR